MQINYCDLCNTPLKEGNYYVLYISEPVNTNTNYNETENFYNYLNRIRKDMQEICPKCKDIFDRMFELRLQRLPELTDEINLTYKLKSKSNPKEIKNGKEKK